jgi:translation elongation factor EF-G
MEKYLAGQEISLEDLKRIAPQSGHREQIVPVLTGSALKNKGVQFMLDAVVDYLPSPQTCRRSKASMKSPARKWSAKPKMRRAVFRPGLQNRDRPVRRQPWRSSAITPAS